KLRLPQSLAHDGRIAELLERTAPKEEERPDLSFGRGAHHVREPEALRAGRDADRARAPCVGIPVPLDRELLIDDGRLRAEREIEVHDPERVLEDGAREEALLVRELGRSDHAHGRWSVLLQDLPQRLGDRSDHLAPRHRDHGFAAAARRGRDSLGIVDAREGAAAAVADPPLIHVLVLARRDAQDLGPPRVISEERVAALRAERADGRYGLELPGTRPEAELFARERSHGTDIRDVPGQLVRDLPARHGADVSLLAAREDRDLVLARDFAAEIHAAHAEAAAVL